MKTRWAFIPCAGLGTRMGDVGKEIPKPLFYFFEKTLLDHQITFCKSLGFENFIINTHHQWKMFNKWEALAKCNVINLFEKQLLGNGGSFHNIKRHHPEIEDVYIFNPDTFLLEDDFFWNDFFRQAHLHQHVLISVPCNKKDKYNRLELDNNDQLMDIVPPALNSPRVTYAGFGKVSLKEIPPCEGYSSFFKTVVVPKVHDIKVIKLENNSNFWDLGTLELYKNLIISMQSMGNSSLYKFLLETGGIEPTNMREQGYRSDILNVYNFGSKENAVESEPGIYFNCFEKEANLPLY